MNKPGWAVGDELGEFFLPWHTCWRVSALTGVLAAVIGAIGLKGEFAWLGWIGSSLGTGVFVGTVVQAVGYMGIRQCPVLVYADGLVTYTQTAEIFATWNELRSASLQKCFDGEHLRIELPVAPHEFWVGEGILRQPAFRSAIAERLPEGHPKQHLFEP